MKDIVTDLMPVPVDSAVIYLPSDCKISIQSVRVSVSTVQSSRVGSRRVQSRHVRVWFRFDVVCRGKLSELHKMWLDFPNDKNINRLET